MMRALCSIGAALLLLATPRARAAAQHDRPYRPGIDVIDYDLTLDLPDTGRVIAGRAVLTVARTARVDTLALDLNVLRVDSVLVDDRPSAFARVPGTIRIPLPPGADDTLRVAVRYGGVPQDGLIIRTDSLGRWTYFGDNWPDRARNWIPSVDHPSDKATVTWTVIAPTDRRVVANGALLEETPLVGAEAERRALVRRGDAPGARTLTRWRESRPIPVYLMVIAAAPLAYYDLGPSACGRAVFPGCVRQSVYVAPEVRDFLPGPFAEAPGIIDWFSRLVGPFPYEKLAHLESSTRFGGMENATAIFYADRPFRTGTMGAGVIAHESAHQWFGDAVTERAWAHLWLSEGFATYFAALWTEHARGDSAFRAEMAAMRDEIVRDPVVATRPVIDTAQTDYLKLLDANSYQKGGWTLHMLRALVGDSAFFRGLRAYYAEHRDGTALTDDLERDMERASGDSLGWFFDQWLRRPGFPELTVRWRYDGRARRVVLEVTQGERFGAYRVPLVVELRDAHGRARRARVEIPATHRATVTVPLAVDAAPAGVAFDPDVQLLATFAP